MRTQRTPSRLLRRNANGRSSFSENLRKMVIFSMLASLMFISKLMMEFLPNMHLIGALIVVYTLVYRAQALIPIYVFVFMMGVYGGFNLWWIPYLYIWTVLWAIVMMLPKKMPRKLAAPIYILVCSLHGLMYGTLYAPAQALMFGMDFKMMLAWIVAGFPWDILHAFGNLISGLLIMPLALTLDKLESKFSGKRSLV